MTDEPGSNYTHICTALEKAGGGYEVKVVTMVSSDYGVPQRRVRLYFIGVLKSKFNLSSQMVDKTLNLFKLKCQKPDTGQLKVKFSQLFRELC